jgi:hypothetical protein
MAVATGTPRRLRERRCGGHLAAAVAAGVNLVAALITFALAILVAEEQWLLVVASWYVTGSWFACAFAALRCLPTETENSLKSWAVVALPLRHRKGDAATGASSTRSRRPLHPTRRTIV